MQVLFVVALQAEATAIIKFYKLKLYLEVPFKIYRGENKWLVVSGIGKINSAAATSYLCCLANDDMHQIWLNVGIAGHIDLPVGTAIIGHKIVDKVTQKKWYPPLLIDTEITTAEIITVDIAETGYPTSSVYEMEAAGFYSIATKFSTSELVHCFKIISDNKKQNITNITRQKIETWIGENAENLDSICCQLQKIAQKLPDKNPREWQEFISTWSFTSAGKKRLRNLLQKWNALNPQSKLLDEQISQQCQNMKQVLVYVEKKVKEFSCGSGL
ncbi:hypothetical protein [Candidatus Uabimicrobium sp. HlEnr_7]|uniref:5'-methylthioadenosine/S-adenosylhomocysteine nucleosidase family protein n=1 Tax=Candidatus Uabimicrobium helgolandensis TaxID=3095367 RepID=UPI003558CB48